MTRDALSPDCPRPGQTPVWPTARAGSWCRRHQALLLSLAGGLALALGVLVYGTDRPAGQAQWAPWLGGQAGSPWFGAWGGSLPTALHVLAFSLWTAALLPPASPWRLAGCAGWTVLNLLAEAAQQAQAQALWTGWLTPPHAAGATDSHPVLHAVAAYAARGQFDPLDLVAALLGGPLAAGVVLALTPRPGERP
jgi:hypothetical protein